MNKRKQFRSEDELGESGSKIKSSKTEPAECPGIAATNRKVKEELDNEQVRKQIPLPLNSSEARKQFGSKDKLGKSRNKRKSTKVEPDECAGIAETNHKAKEAPDNEQLRKKIPLSMLSAETAGAQKFRAHREKEIAVKDIESLPAPPMDAFGVRDLTKWGEIAAAVEARSEEEVDIEIALNIIPKSKAQESAYYDILRDLNIDFTRSRNALAKFLIEGLSCYTQTTSIADGLDELGIPHKDVFTGRRVYNTPPCFFVIAPKNWEEHLRRVKWLCGQQVRIGITISRRHPEPAAAGRQGLGALGDIAWNYATNPQHRR